MSKIFVQELQKHLKDLGLYAGEIDGIAGKGTQQAYKDMLTAYASCAINCKSDQEPTTRKMRWGAKVSPVFRERVLWMSGALQMGEDGPSHLMSCMALETGRTFAPDVKNLAGSSGTGLIQFMSYTAKSMGTTVEALAKLSAEDQLNWVYKYFLPYKGRLSTLGDVYLAILYPKAIGKADEWALWEKGSLAYTQNKGLDRNKDGLITRQEVVKTIEAFYEEGLKYEA